MFGATSFANAIEPKPFDGSNFKRWRELTILWLTAMNVMYVATGKAPEDVLEEKFNADDNLYRGAIISVLVDNLVDTYLQRKMEKDIWEALEAQYGASNAGGELYVMEQLLDYRMVEDRSVVEQAHEVQVLAKELQNYSKEAPCVLPNKFVAGAIITKLPHSLRDFATSLKHKRKDSLLMTLLRLLMLKRRREQKTHVERQQPVPQTQTLCRGAIPSSTIIRTRGRSLHKTRPRLRKPIGLIRRRESWGVLVILVAVRITLLRSARIVKIARLQRQRTWLLARVEEQRGMVISYLQFFQCVLH
jgi:hypothetical protein